MNKRSTFSAAVLCLALTFGGAGSARAAADLSLAGPSKPSLSAAANVEKPIIVAQQGRRNFGGGARAAGRPAFRGGVQRNFRAGQAFRGPRPAVRGPVYSRRAASHPRFRQRRPGYTYFYNGWWYPYQWWLPAAAIGIGVPIYSNSCTRIHYRCARWYGYPSYSYDICMQDNGCY